MRLVAVAIGSLWLAASFQFGLSSRMEIFGGRPDFLLVVGVVLSLMMPRGAAVLVGAAAGLWTGAIIGANTAHYVLSRTVTCFLASWSRASNLELQTAVAAVAVFFATVLAGTIFLFTAAPKAIVPYLLDTIASAVYNGVLAILVYALLRRAVGTPRRR